MKRLTICLLAVLGTALAARAQGSLPLTPDAKVLGMGGVAMTTLSGSHAIYGNSAMAAFSMMPLQVSSSYLRHKGADYYAVTGYGRFDRFNLVQLGWRQYLRERGNNDLAVDLGYSRRIGDSWAVGLVGRYARLKRPADIRENALAVDLSAAWMKPLELGSYSMLRAGARVANLGGYFGDTEERLSMSLTAGAALDTLLTDAHEIIVGVDLGYGFAPRPVRSFLFSVGAEYNLMQLLQVRAGYHYGKDRSILPSFASVGVGARFLHLRLDFAYLIAPESSLMYNTYSISFGFDF